MRGGFGRDIPSKTILVSLAVASEFDSLRTCNSLCSPKTPAMWMSEPPCTDGNCRGQVTEGYT